MEYGRKHLEIAMRPLLKVQEAEEITVSHRDTTLRRQDSLLVDRKSTKIDSVLDRITDEGRRIWNKLKAKNPNFRNISDTLFSRFSVSLFPPLSTNHLLSLNTVNRFAFNILVGQSKGVDGFELGGLVNIDAGNVRYAQIAGITNIVRGDVYGFQLGGITNLNGGSMNGVQIAGIFNNNLSYCDGFQLAGIANLNHGTSYGAQVSGIANINRGIFDGFQLAGISNQVYGTMSGTQLAGVYNSADTLYGFQLAGIVKPRRCCLWCQFGLINLAKTHHGVPIALFSFVRTGYHKLELASDDLNMTTAAFRTGVDLFHNIVFAGIDQRNKNYWTIGYGFGSAFKCSKKWYFDLDLTAQTIQNAQTTWEDIQALGKLFAGFEFRPVKWLNIFGGATFNTYVPIPMQIGSR